MKVKIKIPASSANLGAGFDCLSLGLSLYNQYEVETHTKEIRYSLTPSTNLKLAHNKMLIAYQNTCRAYGLAVIPFYTHCYMQIPIGIGLGSSANAILAGILLARVVHKKSLDRQIILKDALAMEQHPDNLSGCLYGGFNISLIDNDTVKNFNFRIDKQLHCIIVKMMSNTDTIENRQSLPKQYSAKETVYNLSRSALLGVAFAKQNFDLLSYGLEDELHQKYRLPPHLKINKLKNKLQGDDYYGLALSGSGPSLIIFCSIVSQRILCALDEHFSQIKEDFKIYTLKVDNEGASVIT